MFDQVRDVEHLRRDEHFRCLGVVARELRERFLHRVAHRRAFRLHERDRHAVDQKHDIRAVGFLRAIAVAPFVGDLEDVSLRPRVVDESDVHLPLLRRMGDRLLAPQPREQLCVALNRRRRGFHRLDDSADCLRRDEPGFSAMSLSASVA